MAKRSGGYTPKSAPAKTVVAGRTFQLSAAMRKGGQQPKTAPRSKTT